MPNLVAMLLAAGVLRGEDAFGTWKMNAARSRFTDGAPPTSLILRIESHPRGEVFTVDEIRTDGSIDTSSDVLYLDGKPRDYEGPSCQGTQAPLRLDLLTVEIVRNRVTATWFIFVRRPTTQSRWLILDVVEQTGDGRRSDRHLVLEKQ